jgi:hypothetical protein
VKINARGTRDPDRRAAAAPPPELTGQAAIAWRNLIDVDLISADRRSYVNAPAAPARAVGGRGEGGRGRAGKGPVTRAATKDHARRVILRPPPLSLSRHFHVPLFLVSPHPHRPRSRWGKGPRPRARRNLARAWRVCAVIARAARVSN